MEIKKLVIDLLKERIKSNGLEKDIRDVIYNNQDCLTTTIEIIMIQIDNFLNEESRN